MNQPVSSVYKDRLHDSPKKHKWADLEKYGAQHLPFHHERNIPGKTAKKALKYIDTLVKVYPFQLRYAMALPLWYRFCDEWCDSGDEKKAMAAI